MSAPQASILITTRNRKDMLRRAIQSAVEQQGVAVEVVVVDDASTDGTPDMVRSEFPSVRLEASPVKRGYIVQRNLAARIAQAPLLVTIDDDARLSSPHVVQQAIGAFDHPRVGAVAIPAINLRMEDQTPQHVWFPATPVPGCMWVVSDFIGCASINRRDLFLRLGGYREYFFHWAEDSDYCMRLLAAGYVVRLAVSDPVHHFPGTNPGQRHFGHTWRNRLLVLWYDLPAACLPAQLGRQLGACLYFGARGGARHLAACLWGFCRGLGACVHEVRQRRPMPLGVYRTYEKLRRTGGLAFDDVQATLPPMRFGPLPTQAAS